MVQSGNFGYLHIYIWEWIALPFYLFVIFFIAKLHQKKKLEEMPIYKYYIKAIFIKIFGGIVFALIYFYYYQGGDTLSYYESGMTMRNLLFHSISGWASNEFGGASPQNYTLFNPHTGYPLFYMYGDPQTFMVIRLINPLMIFSINGFILTTVLVSWISFFGMWKLFLVFSAHYPHLKKYFFIAILCFPSVVFWGSGILKDSITLSSSGWIVYCVYNVFLLRKKILFHSILLLLFGMIILAIKPYIIFALLPGSLMWTFSHRIYKIKNIVFKLLIVPFIFTLCIASGYLIVQNLGDRMGKFSVDKINTTAFVTEEDLKQDYYNGHSFDLGKFDPTIGGYAKIFPKAFVAGTYRPFIWEAGNAVMLISGLENAFLLYLTLLVLIRTRVFRIFKRLFREPLLFFAFSYFVFFAFAVGLTTSNFGALVRFKIAYLPFFASCLYILSQKAEQPAYSEEEEYEQDEEKGPNYLAGAHTY
jgi:hypothetical protein